jgi:vacuolar-type H+-ATPase subunit H
VDGVTIERRMQALLDIVEAERRAQVDAIVREAQAAAAVLVGDAHREARERMRRAFADERRQRDERIHAARANLQTRRRLTAQQRATTLLDLAWRRLPDALSERWQAPASRRAWTAYIVARARAALPSCRWQISHAPAWPEPERAELAARLAEECGARPEFRADPAILAGLRIAGAGTVVDGTDAGLLRDRAETGARLLAHLDTPGAEP